MSSRYDCADAREREAGIVAAVTAVRHGGLVVLPTDTVYGIGADAFTPSAIAALQEAASKRSRMIARDVHGAFEEAVRQEIEIEREFAEFPRLVSLGGPSFGGDAGAKTSGLFSARLMFEVTGLNNRLPLEFVVTVKAQRESRFSLAAHNELIIKLVQLRMLTPDVGLELMMFDGKQQAQALMAKAAQSAAVRG